MEMQKLDETEACQRVTCGPYSQVNRSHSKHTKVEHLATTKAVILQE